MLYESLGKVCPNPNHEFHNARFRLGTEESIQVISDGTRKRRFKLRMAFESSTTDKTWFDVASIVTAQEGEKFSNHPDDVLEELPDQMDMDTAIESAASDQSFKSSTQSRQHQAGGRSSSCFSYLKNKHCIEHTAHFYLYNYPQNTTHLAAQLKHLEVCKHLCYPDATYLDQVASGVQGQKLYAFVRQKLHRCESSLRQDYCGIISQAEFHRVAS